MEKMQIDRTRTIHQQEGEKQLLLSRGTGTGGELLISSRDSLYTSGHGGALQIRMLRTIK
jgi:hypothetical protein